MYGDLPGFNSYTPFCCQQNIGDQENSSGDDITSLIERAEAERRGINKNYDKTNHQGQTGSSRFAFSSRVHQKNQTGSNQLAGGWSANIGGNAGGFESGHRRHLYSQQSPRAATTSSSRHASWAAPPTTVISPIDCGLMSRGSSSSDFFLPIMSLSSAGSASSSSSSSSSSSGHGFPSWRVSRSSRCSSTFNTSSEHGHSTELTAMD